MARLAIALLLGAAVLASPARAASERELSLEELVQAADEIVVGEVVGSAAHWKGRLIVTDAIVRVDEALKGPGGKKIRITQLGGTAVHPVIGAAVTMEVSSYAALEPGERVLVFVEERRPGVRQLVGAAQGKFVIRDGAARGERTVPVGPKQLRVHRDSGHASITTEATTLERMRDRIRALVGGPTP